MTEHKKGNKMPQEKKIKGAEKEREIRKENNAETREDEKRGGTTLGKERKRISGKG